jgi:hypothetical protein
MDRNSIWFPLGWWEVLRRRALRTTPIALSHKERTPHNPSIALPGLLINNILLVLDDGTSLAFVVDADDFVAELELAAGGGGREGLEEGDFALAVEDAAGVEFWDIGDGDGVLGGVEVDYFLGCVLECLGMLDGSVRWRRGCLRRMMG